MHNFCITKCTVLSFGQACFQVHLPAHKSSAIQCLAQTARPGSETRLYHEVFMARKRAMHKVHWLYLAAGNAHDYAQSVQSV